MRLIGPGRDRARHGRGRAAVTVSILAMIMSVVGGLFTAGSAAGTAPGTVTGPAAEPAAAADPECLRAGEASGPCADELSFPTAFPATPLHGMIFIIAGGGWQSAQPEAVAEVYRQTSDRWLARGYAVAMVEHGDGSDVLPDTPTGRQAFDNVLQWYDLYRGFWDGRAGYGPDFPICATGLSSGGHFALLLGAHRPSLDCVVAEAPPTRIDYKAEPGVPSHAPGIPQEIQYLADRTFSGVQGESPSPSWSPLRLRSQITMPVLIGHASNDNVVLVTQTRSFCVVTAAFDCRAVYLPASKVGAPDFTHANVNDKSLVSFRAVEQAFVCSVVSSVTGPCT